MRTVFIKKVHCNGKGCTASYILKANGKYFQSLEWFHGYSQGVVPMNTITISEDEEIIGEE
jgi:hypothetical protein